VAVAAAAAAAEAAVAALRSALARLPAPPDLAVAGGDVWSEPLAALPSALLAAPHAGRPWAEWLARGADTAAALARQAALSGALAAALGDAPSEGLPDEEAADAMAQLWRLQPFVAAGQLESWAALDGPSPPGHV
jgi:hypothetical protein